MRLDKYVAYARMCTRSEARTLIRQGIITVNGEPIKDPGYTLSSDTSDNVSINGAPLSSNENLYFAFHKPDGYLSALQDKRLPTIADFFPKELLYKGLAPVGRLDFHTTGLLLLTNDGSFSHLVTSPKGQISKVYRVTFSGAPITEKNISDFSRGITLLDIPEKPLHCQPAILDRTDQENTALLTLTEGKTHQVRRMFASINRSVTALERIAIGSIHLSDLPPGTYRPLSTEEIKSFQHIDIQL